MEDVLAKKQWQNAVRVSSTELEESMWNDSDEAAVDYVADGQGILVMDLNDENVVR